MLYVPPDSPSLAAHPKVRERLARSAHAYFRYINAPFSRAVCYAFGQALDDVPPVKLHGDAHLEQYVVTEAGRGLTDFDDSSWGPPVIDLVRFGVSLSLACRERRWDDAGPDAFDAFLAAYVAALHDNGLEASEPGFVARLEEGFDHDRRAFLAWADAVSPEVDAATRRDVEGAFRTYVTRLSEQFPELDASFFRVTRCGSTTLGVGSATDEKYVLRIEGPSPAAEDDIVLEAKELRNIEGIPCVRVGSKANPFRTLVGRVHTPYQPYLGHFGLHGKTFWVHAWLANYEELSISDPLLTRDDLRAVAVEAGVQLARAHLQRWDGTQDRQLGHRVEDAAADFEEGVRAAVATLTQATLDAWERFRAASADSGEQASSPW